ncbi:MAG: EmmdR/YeeO family multidrug/toxin efflux MATE transporter [Vibrio sp.]|uniref:EmmdR/YeeO family multidrug/toxin efflux MATE transporter n=1 Tax=Vibrio sp. TaxID=678 RepID=UPI003A894B45
MSNSSSEPGPSGHKPHGSLFPNLFFKVRYRHKVLLKRHVWPFTWPIILELSCVVLMGIISTVLVARLGADKTAAVGFTDGITWIIISVMTAVALGGSVVVAQSFGRGDRPSALSAAGQVMVLGMFVALVSMLSIFLFSGSMLYIVAYGAEDEVIALSDRYLNLVALSYPALAITLVGSGILRAVGNSRLPAMSNIAMNVLNILFSYPLIYGLHGLFGIEWQGFGMLGAALGITLARWAGAVIILACLTRNSTFIVSLRQYFTGFDKKILFDILSVGVPASVESLMFNLGKLITQIMVAGLGTVAMAGNVITFSLLLLLNIPGNALAMTSTVLVGKRLGQNKPKVAFQEMQLIFWTATIVLCLFSAVFVPLSPYMAAWYTDEAEVVEVILNLILLNAIMMPVWAASWVLPAAFKGAKDAKFAMYISIASMWGGRIVLGYIFGIYFEFGIYGIWFGMFADWWIRGVIFYLRMMRLGWLKNYLKKLESAA